MIVKLNGQTIQETSTTESKPIEVPVKEAKVEQPTPPVKLAPDLIRSKRGLIVTKPTIQVGKVSASFFGTEQIPYSVFEVEASQKTSNANVKLMLIEFARLFRPLEKRVTLEDGTIIYTPEYTIWWEVVIRKESIKFYLVVPDVTDVKMPMRRTVLKHWARSNVVEVKDHMPEFDLESTDLTRVTLQYNPILSLDVIDSKYRILEHLLSAKYYLMEDDYILLQIGMKPLGNSWNNSAKELYDRIRKTGRVPRKKGGKVTGKEVFQVGAMGVGMIAEEFMNFIGDFLIPGWEKDKGLTETLKNHWGSVDSNSTSKKISSDVFGTRIHAIAVSKDDTRRASITRSVTSAFEPLAGDNRLIERPIISNKDKELEKIVNRKFELRSIDILGHLELSKLINVPDEASQIEHYNELKLVTHRTDADIPREVFDDHGGKAVPFGTYEDTDGEHKLVYFDTDVDRFIMSRIWEGESGSGKTTAAANQVVEMFVKQGYGGAVFDVADGKLLDRILSCVPPNLKHKVKILDFLNPDYSIGIGWNEAFQSRNMDIIEDLIVEEIQAYVELVAETKLNMRARTWLGNAVRAVYTTPDATLQDVENMINNSEYRDRVIPTIKDPELRMDWETYHNRFSANDRATIYDEIYRRLSEVIRKKSLKKFLLQKPKKNPDGTYALDFRRWLDEGYLILVKATEAIPPNIQTALVSFLIAKLNLALVSREDTPEEKRPICFAILDEPDHYIKGSERWRNMFVRYRKYHCSLNLMFHGWDQLTQQDRKLPTLIRQAGPHYFILKTEEDNLLELQSILEPTFKVKDLAKGLPKHHAVVKLNMFTKDDQPLQPFMVKMLDTPENRYTQYDNNDLYESCAKELGRPNDEVVEEIFKNRWGADFDIAVFTQAVISDGDGEIAVANETYVETKGDKLRLRRAMEYELANHFEEMEARGIEPDEDLLLELDNILEDDNNAKRSK